MTKFLWSAIVILVLTCLSLEWAAHAQGGMSKATAKLLIADLIDAGFSPQIAERNGAFVITVATDSDAVTALQVHNFATNRGVTARVLRVRFE